MDGDIPITSEGLRAGTELPMAEFTRITLEKNCDISKVEKLHEQLESLLQASTSVAIDGSAVERIDTSTLQLLLSFVTTMGKHHLNVTIEQPSDCFRDTARMMGMSRQLQFND